MNNSFGEMKVALDKQLSESDCKTLATLAGLQRAEVDRIKDGLSLLSSLEKRGKFSKDDVSYLVGIFTKCNLQKAACIARGYQPKSVQRRPDDPLGVMKVDAAGQLTYSDCQAIATVAGFSRADIENMKDGIILMNTLEDRNYYNENDVKQLQELFTKHNFHQAADIIKKYQDSYITDCSNGAATHMEDEIPERETPHTSCEMPSSDYGSM